MPPFPLPDNEEERLVALRSYSILDTAEDKDFDDLTALASAICQTPIALISLVDSERQWFKSHHGINAKETPKELSFCAHAIASSDDIMIVKDATLDERFANNPLVTGNVKLTFYAGVPLVNEDGYALGSLCVIDHEAKELSDEQISALKIIAKHVIDKLELRRKIAALETVNKDLRDTNVFMQKFASMAAHDIKNPLSSILLTSQALKIRLQKLADEGSTRLVDLNIASTRNLMVLLEEMLNYSQSPALMLAKKQNVDMLDMLKKVVTMVGVPDNFDVQLPTETHRLYLSSVAFEQIFINLISNAIRYNDKEYGLISIRFSQDENYYRFEVEDNGMGIAKQYHEKIFTNNFTLKITDRYNKKGTGIGLSTVKELIKALQGNIFVESNVGEGSTFFIRIRK